MTAGEGGAPRLFAARTVLWMVLIGVFSFIAFLALSAYAPDLRSGSDGGAHALSKSAVGFAGLVKLMDAEGAPVLVSRGPPADQTSGILLLTPQPMTDSKEIQAFRYGGVILVVLPKWSVASDPQKPEWVVKLGLLPPRALDGLFGGLSTAVRIERRQGVTKPILRAGQVAIFSGDTVIPAGPVDSLQTISGADLTPALVDDQGRTVLALSRKRAMFILADPDLLNTQGLADLQTGRAATSIIDGLRGSTGPVIFDVTLNGFKRPRSLLRLVLQPPLLGATLCLVFAAGLMGLHAAVRFGPPRRPAPAFAAGKQALADNSAALVRMARREPRMSEGYAALIRESAARAMGLPRDLGPAQTDEALDRLGAGRGAAALFSQLTARARGVKTNAELVAVAGQLFQWMQEMTRGRR